MEAQLIERAPGLGWLAATPPDHAYRIAVTAHTKQEAVARLVERVAAWDLIGAVNPDP